MNSDLCANGYRCLLCGNILDATILENRRRSIDAVEPMTLKGSRLQRFVAV